MLEKEAKIGVEKEFGRHAADTGSPEVQIALITKRMELLTEHFRKHKKDTNSRRGFLMLIGQRRSLLKYLQQTNTPAYQEVLKKLNLRK